MGKNQCLGVVMAGWVQEWLVKKQAGSG